MLPEARRAWLAASESLVGNPSSPHRCGGRADAALAGARESLGRILGCGALDLVFTSGATEGANAVVHHLARATSGAEIWVSAVEHPAILAPAEFQFPQRVRRIPVSAEGVIDLTWLAEQLRNSRPAAIAVMAATNETGVLQPWREARDLARASETPFFCDATQAIGRIPCEGLGECDFLVGSAHKFGGPRGVGFLKCPSQGQFRALLRGGPQEEGRRAGTENVPGVLAMLAALEHRHRQILAGEHQKCAAWKHQFERRLLQSVPGSTILGKAAERLWNTCAILMPESDCRHRWVVKLDKLGFAVSTGSACASGKEEASHVLRAMGISESNAGRALRFSAGWETTEQEWELLLEAVQKAWLALRRVET